MKCLLCLLLFLFILLSVPIIILYLKGIFKEWMHYSGRTHRVCSHSKCGEHPVQPPLGVLGHHCGSPLLQINCSSNNSTVPGFGYWYPNGTPTDVLVTEAYSFLFPLLWSSAELWVVPHPSMSTCAHIQRADFSSLFRNFRSFQKFEFEIPMSFFSMLVFNCGNPEAIRQDQYPTGFSRGGSACTRFARSCPPYNASFFDCFQIDYIQLNNSSPMEVVIAALGCTSFTCSVSSWDNIDITVTKTPTEMYYGVRVEMPNLPNAALCESLYESADCGYTGNGSLLTNCYNGQNLTEGGTCRTTPLRFGLFVSGYSIGVILIVVCVVKRQSVMLWMTGEKYFNVRELSEPPKKMSYRLIHWATQSFNNKIGEGSFGQVFYGLLPRLKTPLAVKVLDNARHSHRQFVAEVESVGNIHHINLVRLIGFCSHKAKRLLVYEFIPNGSLDNHIFSNHREGEGEANPNSILSWERRYSIILGVARGLAYLHHECRQQVVHLDIKPANILLDQHFNAKIADFGLSKLITVDQSKAATAVRGTPGYMAPELWKDSIVSTKCDIYSFGVLIIEVIAGRKWLEVDASSSQLYLPDWAFKKACEEDFLPLVDERVACPEIIEQARILILLSMWCIQQEPCLRPTMIKVVECIEGKCCVPTNPPNPFESTLNKEVPTRELLTNDSSSTSM